MKTLLWQVLDLLMHSCLTPALATMPPLAPLSLRFLLSLK